MTDPKFLHAGDHVHVGLGVIGTRQTNPTIDLYELPRIDVVLLSHYHAVSGTLLAFIHPPVKVLANVERHNLPFLMST
jgi:hypothetical protein